MNKKWSAVLFIVAATVLNIILMSGVFSLMFLPFITLLATRLSPVWNQVCVIIIFAGSVVITYFIYHRIVRKLITRFKLNQYF